jgi:hypothetical protein
MAERANYLIGRAEVLTEITPPPKIKPQGRDLYTIEEVVNRIQPQLKKVNEDLSALDPTLCPRDFAVAELTLHPSYIAKGHFPNKLLREIGVRSIGSKASDVKPDRWLRVGEPELSPTTSIFIAGKRENLASFEAQIEHMSSEDYAAEDLKKVWSINTVEPKNKIKHGKSKSENYLEVGLQLIPGGSSDFIKQSFCSYAKELGFEVRDDLSLEISNLWFIPVIGDPNKSMDLAQHSFVRVVRPVPALRSFRPLVRSLPGSSEAILPKAPPVASDARVAILDGGLPTQHALSPWVKEYRLSDPSALDYPGGPNHGLGVTSAFLFGPLPYNQEAPRPYSYVDHYRVLDSEISGEDPLELYRTLTHIEDILISRQYEFINISLGPDLPIDDDEIHPWTSLLDTYLSDGETFLAIAAGNNGENDSTTGLNRIQVPSDSVNSVAVGASDQSGSSWERACYSAIGPGRAPGRIKPDLLAFGGSHSQYFHVINDELPPKLVPQQGTSFASPYLLRKAVGVRAIFGHDISPLAIKALLVNSANTNNQDQNHVGWGKAVDDLAQLTESPDGVAKIVYQGELKPGKYLHVPVPMPKGGINGMVNIKATCCFSTAVDPQDTSMYTRGGIEITWYPKKGQKSDGFFKQQKKATEAELRRDAAKWETVLHEEKKKNGKLLDDPAFQIHYMAREAGAPVSATKADMIKYAFIVTLEAPKHASIFNDILDSYAELLSEIKPRVTTDIQVIT